MDSPRVLGVSSATKIKKFGDLKKEEHFKRLDRELKLTIVKQMEQKKVCNDKGYCTSPTWPSVSTINADGFDTTGYTNGVASLQVSRVDSEVVSSSTNLRKKLPMCQNYHIPRSPMATSSVKQFPVHEFDRDREIMPPPPVSNRAFHSTKMLSNIDTNNIAQDQLKRRKLDRELQIPLVKLSTGVNSEPHEENSNTSKSNLQEARPRIFSRWRVLLNNNGQLIIKGTLECGKIARSKPVEKRLTNTKVQSVFKHIYLLDGNLIDERNELPDYIRGKFFNGFPDDWDNIVQLWQNYTIEGSKVTFRWPTPITDSDEDLNTEITDFPCFSKKQTNHKKKIQETKTTFNSSASLGYHSRSQLENNSNNEKLSKDNVSNAVSTMHSDKRIDDSGRSSVIKEINTCHSECSPANSSKESHSSHQNTSNSNLKSASYLYEIIREDKLRIILSNLGDKNCPPEYLDKFIQLVDCLRYILSYTPTATHDTENKNQNCQKCNNTTSISESQELNEENNPNIQNKNDVKLKEIHTDSIDKNSSRHIEHFLSPKALDLNNDVNETSDGETYMGIPHMSLNRFMKSKVPRCRRYRDRKHFNKDTKIRCNKLVADEPEPSGDNNVNQLYDSSISSTEDECTRTHSEEQDAQSNERFTPTVNNYRDNTTNVNSLKQGKQKPVIKNYEPVKINLKLMKESDNKNFHNSDVSIINNDESIKKQSKQIYLNSKNSCDADNNDEKLSQHVLEHPFLTYDSEDFLNNEEANMNIQLPSHNSTTTSVTKNSENKEKNEKISERSTNSHQPIEDEPFGSIENPKLLSSWIPCVVYSDKTKTSCGLTFEGKLLNEAGHVLHRKFVTDLICERISSTVVQTINNEYFKLVGEFNDRKHVVPKELLKHCRTGCPSKIKEFCEEWRKINAESDVNKYTSHNDTSVNDLTVPTSSRGRKIIPPLNYWDGERITTKDEDVVYNPGNTQKATLVTRTEEIRKSTITSDQKSQKVNNKKEKNMKTQRNSIKPMETSMKKRVAQKWKCTSSSDSDGNQLPSKENVKDSSDTHQPKVMEPPTTTHILIEPVNTTNRNLRKRQKVNYVENNKKFSEKQHTHPTSNVLWSLDKGEYHDVLSDDQASVIK